MLLLAVAAPPDREAAMKHDDDFGVAYLDFAEIAFRVTPAFRPQPFPAPVVAGPESGPGRVFRAPVSPRWTIWASVLWQNCLLAALAECVNESVS